jgi:hypothetical protein
MTSRTRRLEAVNTQGGWQLQENNQEKKNLYYAFVDLEKAFNRVQRDVTRWALRKAGVAEWLVLAVMAIYEGQRRWLEQMMEIARALQ